MIIECPKCKISFDNYSKWGPKKFCSRQCANSRIQTNEIKERKSKACSQEANCKYCGRLSASKSGNKQHEKSCEYNYVDRVAGSFFGQSHSFDNKIKITKNNTGIIPKIPTSLLDMSSRTTSKIMKRLDVGCFICGWKEGLGDIHHILPTSKGGTDHNSNLTYLCPNHHRLAHEGTLTTFISIADKIGEEWRKFYFSHK